MAYGVNHYQDVEGAVSWEQPNPNGEEGYVWTQEAEVHSRTALYVGLGILAGIGLGALAWALGDKGLDSCAAANCLADGVNISGIKLPFSGDELPVIIRSFGLGN